MILPELGMSEQERKSIEEAMTTPIEPAALPDEKTGALMTARRVISIILANGGLNYEIWFEDLICAQQTIFSAISAQTVPAEVVGEPVAWHFVTKKGEHVVSLHSDCTPQDVREYLDMQPLYSRPNPTTAYSAGPDQYDEMTANVIATLKANDVLNAEAVAASLTGSLNEYYDHLVDSETLEHEKSSSFDAGYKSATPTQAEAKEAGIRAAAAIADTFTCGLCGMDGEAGDAIRVLLTEGE